jgi:HAD superfamily hydrolase (TIGR01484 family)
MKVLATDLDRTLLPNGKQPNDGSLSALTQAVKQYAFEMIYVTGRDLPLVLGAIAEYDPPLPHYVIAEVGTRIYRFKPKGFTEDKEWIHHIGRLTQHWDIPGFKKKLAGIPSLRLQEKKRQNQFKLSYYLDDLKRAPEAVEMITARVHAICPDASIIFSVDETKNQGLLDILSRHATKITAIEYLRTTARYRKDDIIYCGDSGNDLLPLTFGYTAIVVRNALDEIKKQVLAAARKKGFSGRIYVAKGYRKLNGYYASGILEGLIKLGLVNESYAG